MDERYEEFVHVYHIYDGVDGECAFVYDGDIPGVLTENDEYLKTGLFTQGSMYAAIRALYGDIPLSDDRQFIPTKIAVAGKPAMVAYQYMAHIQYYRDLGPRRDEGKRAVAGQFDVSRETVQKYFRRVADHASELQIGGIRDRRYWF
jgi:hypothetical protein